MIVTDRKCRECGRYWVKNHLTDGKGRAVHVGYYHQCKGGEVVRVGMDMRAKAWDAPLKNTR